MIIYNYKGIGGCDCKCGLEVHKNLVIATEIPENEGTSVTNWAAHLATRICESFKIDPDKLVWIERYPDRGRFNERTGEYQYPEDFSVVTFTRKEKSEFVAGELTVSIFSSPVWHHIEKETVQGLIEAYTTKPESLEHWTETVKTIIAKKAEAGNTGLPSNYFQ